MGTHSKLPHVASRWVLWFVVGGLGLGVVATNDHAAQIFGSLCVVICAVGCLLHGLFVFRRGYHRHRTIAKMLQRRLGVRWRDLLTELVAMGVALWFGALLGRMLASVMSWNALSWSVFPIIGLVFLVVAFAHHLPSLVLFYLLQKEQTDKVAALMEKTPSSFLDHNLVAMALLDTHQPKRALGHLQHEMTKAPLRPLLFQLMIDAYHELGQREEANRMNELLACWDNTRTIS